MISRKRRVGVVFAKEVRDNLRDRKSVSTTFLFTLIGPVVTAGMLVLTVKSTKDDEPIKLPVRGADNAPGLVAFLQQHNLEIIAGGGDLEEAVKNGLHDAALVIPSDFRKSFRASRPARVQLIFDASRRSVSSRVSRVRRLIKAYDAQIGNLRLVVRGIDPSLAVPIRLERVDVSTPESLAAMLLGMVPFFVIISIFMGGYYIVVDATAGELERGSLEPLLTNPVPRWEFLVGKFAAAFFFSAIGLGVAMIGYGLVPHFVSTEGLGMRIQLDASVLLQVYLLVVPLIGLATAAGMIISTLSKSYKEAQSMLSFLMILPVVPGLLITVLPFKAKLWMMLLPILSEQVLIDKLIRGDTIDSLHVAVCWCTTGVAAVVGLAVAVRLYSGERLFARK